LKISDHIKHSIDASVKRDLDQAMLFACLAVDGSAKKSYPEIKAVGRRFRKFIKDNMDIIERMYGGINLEETVFPFTDSKGNVGMKFEDIIYEKFRCHLAHGDELEDGYGITLKIAESHHTFLINLEERTMTVPESCIFALGFACVLAPANSDLEIGNSTYHYHDSINQFVVDSWWGKVDCARQIIDFDHVPRVKIDFSNYVSMA
jgi:hypothetical protein